MRTLNSLKEILEYPTNKMIEHFTKVLFTEYQYNFYAECYDEANTFLYKMFSPPDEHFYEETVMLVAHADIVGNDQNIKLFQRWGDDSSQCIFSCGSRCLDDRTGIVIILNVLDKLIKENIYPFILITGQEELGCEGAIALLEDYSCLETLIPNNKIQCLIEVDRRSADEVVFYDLKDKEFEDLFTANYKKQTSFAWTDITVLAPIWNIAAANVSAGYYYEHTDKEFTTLGSIQLCIMRLYYTIVKILNVAKQNDKSKFVYNGSMQTACQLMLNYQSAPVLPSSWGQERINVLS